MLRWRLSLGSLLITAVVGLCWLDYHAAIHGVWLLPVAAIVSVLATHEVLELAALANLHPLRWTVYCGNLLPMLCTWMAMVANHRIMQNEPVTGPFVKSSNLWPFVDTPWTALGPAVLLVFLGEMFRYKKPGGNFSNLAAGTLAIVYVGMMLAFVVQLRMMFGVGALVSWVIVVKMGDTGAYTVGRLIGRHKMAPRISPGKTIEGGVGALAFSCLGSWFSFQCLVPLMELEPWSKPSPWWGWIVFGLLVGGAGMMGDLAESLLKRDVGRKDSSTWMPGFGGVLDIFDSLFLAAPAAWACWAFGLVS